MNNSRLTKVTKRAKIRRMRSSKTVKTRLKLRKDSNFERRYNQFFMSPLPILRHDDNDNSSLEQPSPLKWVPSETTYGIGEY